MSMELWIPTRGGQEASERLFLSLMPMLAHEPLTWRLRFATDQPIDLHVYAAFAEFADTEVIDGIDSIGEARGVALREAEDEVIAMMDDDAVVVPWTGIARLIDRLNQSSWAWAVPIIRYAENLVYPMQGHTELWKETTQDDPRVVEAIETYGRGWIRTFDIGIRWVETDQLGGTCFAINRDAVPKWAIDRLLAWPADTGDEDAFLGRAATPGVVYNDVFAYHSGRWHSGTAWEKASEELMCLE